MYVYIYTYVYIYIYIYTRHTAAVVIAPRAEARCTFESVLYVCAYVKIRRHQHTRVRARTGPRPELRRVADTTSHGLSAGRHSTQTTIGSPGLCGRPKGGR